jgi:membrane protease YdiL (CAAX protease family)
MPSSDAAKRITAFLVVTFGFSAIFWFLINRSGGMEGGGEVLFIQLMWMPGLAALVITFIFQRNLRGMGWKPGKPVYYLIAFSLPIVYITIVYGAAWILGLGSVDTSALSDNFWMALIQTLTIGAVMAFIFATGEEIGWRGLLVPQLARIHPFARTALISGIVWGAWHIPVIVAGGYTSGAPAWYAIACFTVMVTAGSFVYAWLRLASGSIWPAALLHAIHNAFIQGVMDKITVDTGNTEYFTTEFGLFLPVLTVIIAVIFWRIGIPGGKRFSPPMRGNTPALRT